MLRPRRAPRGTAVALLAAALTAGGCSGTADDPEAAPSPSTSVSTSPPSSPSTDATSEPEVEAPQPPKARRGPAGQEAFARHVMESWVWALRHNDASPLLEASASSKRPCVGCVPLDKELRKRTKEGWYVDLPGISVQRTRMQPEGEVVVATSRVDIPASDSYYDDDSYRSTSPAHDDATFTVRMKYTQRGYVLESFTVA
jgi:hypothetical protein